MIVFKGKRPADDTEFRAMLRGVNGPFCFEGDQQSHGFINWLKQPVTVQRWILIVVALLIAMTLAL